MKSYIPVVVRVLMGFIFTASALAGIMGKVPPPEPEAALAFMGVLMTSGLLYVVKAIELVCGLALIAGRFVPLALLFLAPIVVNIAYFHVALDPSGAPIGLLLVLLWLANAMNRREVLLPLTRM